MNKQIIITAAVFGMLAVIAGAFGAHGLKALIEPERLEIWHTAVEYQFYHVFALLFLSTFSRGNNKLIMASYFLFSLGIVLFSGSLYLLACSELLDWDGMWIMGPVTPVGGLLFIIGWLVLAIAAFRK